jgi:predicted nucleic-acid-binding Zn-ribbon protein
MEKFCCPKCGPAESIPHVKILDHAHMNTELDLSVQFLKHPDAWAFKGPVKHRLHVQVCGACGYTEFYVEDPQGLLAAARSVADD